MRWNHYAGRPFEASYEGIMDPNKQASAKDVARKLIDSIDGESEGKNAN